MRDLRTTFSMAGICGPLFFAAGRGDDVDPIENKVSGKVMARAERPGGGASAVVTQYDSGGGATVGFLELVYVVGTGTHARTELMMRVYNGKVPEVSWTDAHHLVIRLSCGHILHFSNCLCSCW